LQIFSSRKILFSEELVLQGLQANDVSFQIKERLLTSMALSAPHPLKMIRL